jgi:hypothetical protein
MLLICSSLIQSPVVVQRCRGHTHTHTLPARWLRPTCASSGDCPARSNQVGSGGSPSRCDGLLPGAVSLARSSQDHMASRVRCTGLQRGLTTTQRFEKRQWSVWLIGSDACRMHTRTRVATRGKLTAVLDDGTAGRRRCWETKGCSKGWTRGLD